MKEHIDGRKLVAWLEERGKTSDLPDESLMRALNHWRSGVNPHYSTVDRWFVKVLDLHLNEIPDDFYVARQNRRPRRTEKEDRWVRERGLEMLREGYWPGEVAKQLAVNPRTVRNWQKKLEVQS